MRLNKLLSSAGVASRRVADDLIRQGRVEINGHVVDKLGTQADPEKDDIKVDGRRLKKQAPERRYLLMYKPRGVVSTRSDPEQRTTVIDVLNKAGIRGYFYPVGRLDYDSEGLLIMTNDGAFAERVTHPRYELERTYEVDVEGTPEERDLERLRTGISLDGRKTLPAKVKVLRHTVARKGSQTLIELTLREGRNRQVRRMCDAIAHPVDRLCRTRIGPVSDSRIRPGQIRDLTPAEIKALTAPVEKAQGPGEKAPRSSKARDAGVRRRAYAAKARRSAARGAAASRKEKP